MCAEKSIELIDCLRFRFTCDAREVIADVERLPQSDMNIGNVTHVHVCQERQYVR